jgi:hypothetical protein
MFKKDEEEFNKLHQRFAQPLDNSTFLSPDTPDGEVRFVLVLCSISWKLYNLLFADLRG